MAMKSPTPILDVSPTTMQGAANLMDAAKAMQQRQHIDLRALEAKLKLSSNGYNDCSRKEESVEQLDNNVKGQDVVDVPQLLKMVREPLVALGAPKLGISRSQEEANDEELNEQRFGSVSPIFHASRKNISAVGANRANNFRAKFRKSHTCGSLFANCSCSEEPAALLNSPEQHSGDTSLLGTRATFHISISPTNLGDTSPSSKHTSGIYTLSTQTSAATSAQLSHDDSMSMSTSFDSAHAGEAADSAKASSAHESTQRPYSLKAARQANSTEAEAHGRQRLRPSATTNNLQVPRISSPTLSEHSVPVVRPPRKSEREREHQRKNKRLFQSYSHPDTDFVFTDENKHPSRESLAHLYNQTDTVISSRGGRVEIKHPKRSSSPNIGQYQVLDVAVHPDILVKISPRHSPIADNRRIYSPPAETRPTQQRRRLLQRSHEFESSSSTSGSEHSFEVKAQSPTSATELEKSIQSLGLQASAEWNASKAFHAVSSSPSLGASRKAEDASFNAAQKYFAESGILGPIHTSSNLIRKTSRILQDSNVIEQIRKTSMILRANTTQGNSPNKRTSPVTSTSSTPTGSKAPTPPPPTSPLKQRFPNNVSMETPATIIYQQPASQKSQHSMATTCGFSPNLNTNSIDDRDAHIKGLQGEVVSLQDVIKSRDAEIVKLRREIHKLKSVLQQTTNHLPLANDDLLQSPLANYANRCFSPPQCTEISSTHRQQTPQTCLYCKQKIITNDGTAPVGVVADNNGNSSSATSGTGSRGGSIDSNISENYQSCSSLLTPTVTCALVAEKTPCDQAELGLEAVTCDALACAPKNKLLQLAQAPVLKKQGVSGESCETALQQSFNITIPKYDKDYSSKQLIKDAIMDNDFLKNIDASQVRELVESMYSLSVSKGEFVIREGEAGAHLYVSAEGEFEVVKSGKVLGIMGPGKAFGELAILYNCTRTASIRVLSDARVWVLDRRVFQQIMMRTGMQRIEDSVNFLKSVPLLKNLSEEVLAKIADVLEVEFYPAGTYIIRQGASGDTFFLISQGTVKVTQKLAPATEEKEIRMLERGDYFGEQALINEDKRTANIIAMAPGVECLTLDRESFTHLIGDLCELKEKNYGDENRVLAMKYEHEKAKEIFGANVQQEFPDMKLTDLEVIATLGIGGFGRVELVKAYRDNHVDTFALKCLKKRHIVDTKQEEHIFSERTIMLTCRTPFICRLYRTFRDEKYVYMLLEACMGGEIWTMLRDRGSFDENATQFIIGCVLQAFEYLHSRGIIYRDLKPENLMLDERGYVKLVDFGFAKYIGNSSKTWTFCGTPEYVAPEIILNKGHDRAVDYWALGILIHELLNGTPPFTANDPMKTYNIILKGIDMIDFPKHMSRWAVQLIKRLCRDVPAERLGYQKGGIQDIKKHKWFQGFDWESLESQLLIPPFVRPIAHPTDTCYFDKFPCDPEEPPDEFSGWDEDF